MTPRCLIKWQSFQFNRCKRADMNSQSIFKCFQRHSKMERFFSTLDFSKSQCCMECRKPNIARCTGLKVIKKRFSNVPIYTMEQPNRLCKIFKEPKCNTRKKMEKMEAYKYHRLCLNLLKANLWKKKISEHPLKHFAWIKFKWRNWIMFSYLRMDFFCNQFSYSSETNSPELKYLVTCMICGWYMADGWQATVKV